MIFLDASVLLAAEDTDDSHHTSCVALLRTGALATVGLALYETVNVAQTCRHDTTAATRLSDRIWAIAELGALVRVNRTLAEQITVLSAQHALSAYDAAYVAGAQHLGVPLASCDERDLVSRGLAHLPSDLLTS